MLAGLDAGEQRGQQQRMLEAGLRPPPGAHGRSDRSRASIDPPTAAKPSACASRTRRDQSGAGSAPANEMRRRDRALRHERLLLRRERGRRLLVVAAMHNDGEPPLVDPRRDVDVELEGRRPDLGEPEAELLDKVERQPVAARRLRRPHRHISFDFLAGRDRALRSGCRGPSQTIALPRSSSQW